MNALSRFAKWWTTPGEPWHAAKPKELKPILVRKYEHRDTKRVTEMYEKDASALAKQGYEVANVASLGPKPASLLLGGVGLLAPTALVVTYRLRDRM